MFLSSNLQRSNHHSNKFLFMELNCFNEFSRKKLKNDEFFVKIGSKVEFVSISSSAKIKLNKKKYHKNVGIFFVLLFPHCLFILKICRRIPGNFSHLDFCSHVPDRQIVNLRQIFSNVVF